MSFLTLAAQLDLSLSATLKDGLGYMNQDQRNVHIWCHPEDLQPEQIHLVAGFYNHDNLVTYKTVYEWLDEILEELDNEERWLLLQWGPRDATQSDIRVARRPWEWHPQLKTGAFPGAMNDSKYPPADIRYWNALEKKLAPMLIPRSDNSPCRPGHYMLVAADWIAVDPASQPANGIQWYSEPELKCHRQATILDINLTSETSQSEAGGKTNSRSAGTRSAVRKRDKHCKVTKQGPAERARGTDYTTLEVAHIFPLGYAGHPQVIEWLTQDPEAQDVVPLVEDRKEADKPWNAILLRCDIHRFFDTFQWGVWKGTIYRFEKLSSASLPGGRQDVTVQLLEQQDLTKMETVLRFHFHIVLVLHFVGQGTLSPTNTL